MRKARLVDERKQALADRVKGFLILARGVCTSMQARRGGPALDLARVQQRGEILGNLSEHAALAIRLGRLDRVPIAQHLSRVGHLGVGEHVRMATDQLLAAMLGHLREVPGTSLLQQQREEQDLEKHVAQLVKQLCVLATVRRVG